MLAALRAHTEMTTLAYAAQRPIPGSGEIAAGNREIRWSIQLLTVGAKVVGQPETPR